MLHMLLWKSTVQPDIPLIDAQDVVLVFGL